MERAHLRQRLARPSLLVVRDYTPTGLIRFYVFFVTELHTRRVEIAGIKRQPHGAWMLQVARNLLDADDGFLLGKRYLLMDRDPLYTTAFREFPTAIGVKPVRLPPRSPNLNAYAERFVRSVKSECLDKLVLFGERHLRSAVSEYAAHYHTERNHQGINSQIIQPIHISEQADLIVCRERLGGLLHFYHRAGAG
ncbi:integrase core domain-containing protein [Haliangium ochraceum]|uniref:integrase core domain-containing protein n=1 Tax=Haliangium ochraceum TaxID=80816 RepID=UPI00019B9669|nr:integrase core domain-containing protein [Haliangium ochraceum]